MREKKVIQALAALGQETRLSIFRFLMEREAAVPAGEISEQLSVPATTLSFHLSQLKNAGLIRSQKEGRLILYSARRKRAKKMAKYILARPETEDEEYNL